MEKGVVSRGRYIFPKSNYVPVTIEEAKQTIEELQLKVNRLQMEHDALLKANELLNKANDISLRNLPNKDKAVVIDAFEGEISAERITHNNRTGLIRMVDYVLKRVPYFDSRQYFSSSRVKDIETSSTYS